MFLCRECLAALNKAHQFKEQCLRSDTLLKTQLKDVKESITSLSDVLEFNQSNDEAKLNLSEDKLENQDDGDDIYVLVVNKNDADSFNSDAVKQEVINEFHIKTDPDEQREINYDEAKNSLDDEDKIESTDQNEISFDNSKIILPNTINSHSSNNEPKSDTINFHNNKINELDLNLPLSVSDDLQNGKFNIIPLWKDNNEIVETTLIELENCDSPLALSSEIAIEDNITYTQEEIEVENGEESYEIVDCNISELNLNTLPKKNHPITVIQQEDGTFLCDCGESFRDLTVYEKHLATHNKLTCPVCGKGFESKEVIMGHMLLHERSDSHLPCPFCKKVIRRNLLTVHINTNHGPNRPTCSICRKTFATEHNRKRHMLIHLSSKDYECDVCHIKFNHKMAMQNHRLLHEKSYELRCQDCFKEFATESELKTHQNDGCGFVIEENDSDQKHICKKCGKTYSSQSSLHTHVEFVHGFEHSMFLCAECGETFSEKKAMLAHSYIHRQNRPKINKKLVCNVCNKPFVSLAMLLMHERVHTNERPYKCNKCTFAFKTKTHLATHQLTHTQEKRFGCSVCMKFFALKGNLIVHLRTHTGERPYVCNICSQAFIDSKYLKKHKLRRHGMEMVLW